MNASTCLLFAADLGEAHVQQGGGFVIQSKICPLTDRNIRI
jgi:hypothetical protein